MKPRDSFVRVSRECVRPYCDPIFADLAKNNNKLLQILLLISEQLKHRFGCFLLPLLFKA